MTVQIHPIGPSDEPAFLSAVRRSAALFEDWVAPPDTPERFATHLDRCATGATCSYLAWTTDAAIAEEALVGCVNISEIVRGAFQSAYLGYYALAPNHGRGLMKQTLRLVVSHAFGELGLHRLEANIQPGNARSITLVRSLGFRHEGFSPRYLKIAGEWRDHERYAVTAEEWDG